MNGYGEFKIFGIDHILAIFFLIIISIFIPILLKGKSRNNLYLFTSILALVIIANEFVKPFYYPYLFPERYEFFSMLPFHLCNLASFLIAFHLLFNKKLLFDIAFFWGIGGCSMALTQPDISHTFPHPHFLLYFFSHGMLFFAIFLTSITFRERPDFEDLKKVILISIPTVAVIYVINLSINYFVTSAPANYWYLMEFPLGANLTAFMPEPPAHIPVFASIGLILFGLIYLPFFIYDKVSARA